ncbi:Uncharacterised protein [Actinomyces howellii]|uniref:Uncharacterized protein n=2 Tax=Actinomyces howellii TaxID=52771 RepID=A0A3S4R136_9ACTO|nr:Uncharacterised protein [Actinomyces howellii]
MDPVVATLLANLAEISARNTTSAIIDKINTAKAKKRDEETIQILSEIVNALIQDREDLVTVAQGLKQQLVSQQISDDDIKHIVETVVPLIETIGNFGENQSVAAVEPLRPLLSQDTLKVLQTLGFSYREAIGEPLTSVVRSYISSLEKSSSNRGQRTRK